MKVFLSEKNLVVVLFVMVLITFSLAQEDSKKMEQIYIGANSAVTSGFLAVHLAELKTAGPGADHVLPASVSQ